MDLKYFKGTILEQIDQMFKEGFELTDVNFNTGANDYGIIETAVVTLNFKKDKGMASVAVETNN